jgi:hypothetical protein
MIPDGEVRVVANELREWATALVESNFSYEANENKAIAILDKAAVELATDPRVSHYLLDKPEIFGWNNISS